jgi:hypothetical protein
VSSIRARPSAKRFADIRADRLNGLAHLRDVKHPAASGDQGIHAVSCALSSIQHIEISVGHAPF